MWIEKSHDTKYICIWLHTGLFSGKIIILLLYYIIIRTFKIITFACLVQLPAAYCVAYRIFTWNLFALLLTGNLVFTKGTRPVIPSNICPVMYEQPLALFCSCTETQPQSRPSGRNIADAASLALQPTTAVFS